MAGPRQTQADPGRRASLTVSRVLTKSPLHRNLTWTRRQARQVITETTEHTDQRQSNWGPHRENKMAVVRCLVCVPCTCDTGVKQEEESEPRTQAMGQRYGREGRPGDWGLEKKGGREVRLSSCGVAAAQGTQLHSLCAPLDSSGQSGNGDGTQGQRLGLNPKGLRARWAAMRTDTPGRLLTWLNLRVKATTLGARLCFSFLLHPQLANSCEAQSQQGFSQGAKP